MEKLAELVAAFPEIFERHGIVLDKNGSPILTVTIERRADGDKIAFAPKMPIESDEFDSIVSLFYDGETCEIALTENGVSRAKINGIEIDERRREERILQLHATSWTIRFGGSWLMEALEYLPFPDEIFNVRHLSVPETNPFADLVHTIFKEMVEARNTENGHRLA